MFLKYSDPSSNPVRTRLDPDPALRSRSPTIDTKDPNSNVLPSVIIEKTEVRSLITRTTALPLTSVKV